MTCFGCEFGTETSDCTFECDEEGRLDDLVDDDDDDDELFLELSRPNGFKRPERGELFLLELDELWEGEDVGSETMIPFWLEDMLECDRGVL
jgi:hypothetical protein